ncbi:MAG: TlpA disulfide reductase family protein [Usitatibacter sp.]
MKDFPSTGSPRRSRWAALSIGAALIAAAGIVIQLVLPAEGTKRVASAQPRTVAGPGERRPIPRVQFQDGEGKALTLSDFRGKAVLLNVWATWCAPCREEMPSLDRLQRELGGASFEVLAVSVDSGGAPAVRRFFGEMGVRSLAIYVDPSTRAMETLRIVGVPTTLLVDREGRELWRRAGPAQWDSPEMVKSLRLDLARP